MAMNVKLSPASKKFAEDCVTQGRYENVDEVVNSALRLLQDQEARRQAFVRSLEEAQAEAERDGYFTIEEVVAEMKAAIDEVEAERAKEIATAQD
jgi:putative addiction module CopG family antidote